MRIAFLSHFYPPSHNSGIEQATHSLAQGLLKAGHEVRVLCVETWASGDEYWQGYRDDEWQGVRVRRLRVNWTKAEDPNRYLYDNPVMAEQTRLFLSEFTPDIVHVASMYTLSASIIEVAKEFSLPVVFTLSDFWAICPRHTLLRYGHDYCDGRVSAATCQDCLMSESRLYKGLKHVVPMPVLSPIFRGMLQQPGLASHVPGTLGWGIDVEARREKLLSAMGQVDLALAPSQFIRDTILNAGLPLDIKVSHYGNNLDWLADYTPRQQDGRLHIGYMGQIHRLKGVDILVRAFQLANLPEDAHLYIYGSLDSAPDYVDELRFLAGDNPNIHFEGPFLRYELPAVLGNMDVLVVPSNWPEVAGLVVQEAFAARIPVIASRMGGLPEFVQEGRGGLLFDPRNPDELIYILQQIVEGGQPLLDEMRAAIPPVRTTADEVSAMTKLYTEVRRKISLNHS